MKVAFCLYGLTGGLGAGAGRGNALHPAIAHFYYARQLEGFGDFDVFCHTYSAAQEQDIIETYRPKAIEVTENVHLGDTPEQYSPNYENYLSIIRGRENGEPFIKHLAKMQGSKWHSVQRSVRLKSAYEQEHGFLYDRVFITRYDMLFFRPTNLAALDPARVYGAKRNSVRSSEFQISGDNVARESAKTVQDYFYISNSPHADLIGDFFDHRFQYSVRPSFAIFDYLTDRGVTVETPFNLGHDVFVARFLLNGFDDFIVPSGWED